MANEYVFQPNSYYDKMWQYEGNGEGNDYAWVGYSSNFGMDLNGLIRFQNVTLERYQEIYDALVRMYGYKAGSKQVQVKIVGINKDDCPAFTSWIPGSDDTSQYSAHYTEISGWGWFNIGVKSIVQAIVNRANWVSGNSMGFKLYENGTDHSGDSGYFLLNPYDFYLEVLLNPRPNFKPTPISISAPTFPPTSNYGIKISKPGYDVKNASEANLHYTSRKKMMTVYEEMEITTTAFPHVINHSLGYAPMALVYGESESGKKVKFNRIFDPNYIDPIGGLEGYYGTTSTQLKIYTAIGVKVYYYILINPLT